MVTVTVACASVTAAFSRHHCVSRHDAGRDESPISGREPNKTQTVVLHNKTRFTILFKTEEEQQTVVLYNKTRFSILFKTQEEQSHLPSHSNPTFALGRIARLLERKQNTHHIGGIHVITQNRTKEQGESVCLRFYRERAHR